MQELNLDQIADLLNDGVTPHIRAPKGLSHVLVNLAMRVAYG